MTARTVPPAWGAGPARSLRSMMRPHARKRETRVGRARDLRRARHAGATIRSLRGRRSRSGRAVNRAAWPGQSLDTQADHVARNGCRAPADRIFNNGVFVHFVSCALSNKDRARSVCFARCRRRRCPFNPLAAMGFSVPAGCRGHARKYWRLGRVCIMERIRWRRVRATMPHRAALRPGGLPDHRQSGAEGNTPPWIAISRPPKPSLHPAGRPRRPARASFTGHCFPYR